jgi:DNA-binding CsgD family transcriptional regulator
MSRKHLQYALLYGAALALIAALLQWLEQRYFLFHMPGEIYIGALALLFIAIGIWAGTQLTSRQQGARFERNDKAIAALGLTPREYEILEHLALGSSNKEIARALDVSPNTIKTHISNLYLKLDVTGRGKAVEAARALALIP